MKWHKIKKHYTVHWRQAIYSLPPPPHRYICVTVKCPPRRLWKLSSRLLWFSPESWFCQVRCCQCLLRPLGALPPLLQKYFQTTVQSAVSSSWQRNQCLISVLSKKNNKKNPSLFSAHTYTHSPQTQRLPPLFLHQHWAQSTQQEQSELCDRLRIRL